jgi:polyphosphate kinase
MHASEPAPGEQRGSAGGGDAARQHSFDEGRHDADDQSSGREQVPAAETPEPVAGAMSTPLSREHSILAFNRRVLAQARRADVPLLERLRYVTIVSSNLDEFFEVRFADVAEAARAGATAQQRAEIEAVAADAHALIEEQYTLLNDELTPALERAGIRVLNHAQRGTAQRAWVRQFFETQVRPLLLPVQLDPSHPFPQVANKSLNFIVRSRRRQGRGEVAPASEVISILRVPRTLPRVIRLPDALCRGTQGFVLLTSVIRAHLGSLFAGQVVEAFSQFRVTRDSDIELDEDEHENLRQAVRTGLSTRHYGQAIRLEVVRSCPPELSSLLLRQFALPPAALYAVNGPVNLVRLNQLIDLADGAALRFRAAEPCWPAQRLPRGVSVMARIAQDDVLLHHPFESFEPVVAFLREAVHDPAVLAIKQTVYRTGRESVLMELLIEAARRGKDVTAIVELKARFDEEANINWAERLEAVGVQVAYGVVGLKTHAKLLLVTRRESLGKKPSSGRGPGKQTKQRLRHYLHLSTGNYNPATAKLYTDIGMLTTNPQLCADALALFRYMAHPHGGVHCRELLPAPQTLHAALLSQLQRVAESAKRGYAARVVAKMNALTDPQLVQGLLDAGRAGASIDLIVRGACTLRPGVPGHSENIRVRSVIGRFLEHSRIFWFDAGPKPGQQALYLSSADWMTRNMQRRVELAWPIKPARLRQRILDECLVPYLHDGVDAWRLAPDGSYSPIRGGASAQQALLHKFSTPQ